MKHTLKILFIPLLVIVLAGCQFSLNPFASTATTPGTVSTPTLSPLTNASDSALQLQNRMITIYHQVNPGVVSVFVITTPAADWDRGLSTIRSGISSPMRTSSRI